MVVFVRKKGGYGGNLFPQSKGGSDEVSNLRPVCSVCNQSMYNYNFIEFAKKYYPESPLHQTFVSEIPSEKHIEEYTINELLLKIAHLEGEVKNRMEKKDGTEKKNRIKKKNGTEKKNQIEKKNIEVKPPIDNVHQCHKCGYVFARRDHLLRHLRNSHKDNQSNTTI